MTHSFSSKAQLFRALPLCLALGLGAGWLPAHATHVGEDLTADQQVVASNDQLLNGLRQWENAPPAVREARLRQLVQLAAQRQERLLRLLDRNPKLAALRLLPDELRAKLPAAAQVHMEQEVQIQGAAFAAVGDDFARGITQQKFFLQVANGARFELHMADAAGSTRDMLGWAGKQLNVGATQLDGRLIVRDKRRAQVVAAGATTTATGGTVAATTVVQGSQKTLAILVNFTDKALTCTAVDVSNRIFGTTGATVNTNYQQSSRGLVSFTGQAVGPFNIPYVSGGTCDYSGWGAAADNAARAAGVDPALFSRVSYVLPGGTTCGWSGLAYMPGKQSWIAACSATGIYSHEFGHNLSLHHAATPTSEYGDGSDPMGGAAMVGHNGANVVMAGWLPAGGVVDVTVGGSYALTALEYASASTPQVLRINKPDTAEKYYISLRQAVGQDATTLPAVFQNSLSVHRSTGTLPAKTYLLQNLAVGQSFSDAGNGITVSLQGISGSVATVNVAVGGGGGGGSTCTPGAPVVALAPASKNASAGASVAYSLSVTNQNSSGCGTSTFNLSHAMPVGFSASLPASLAIAAGATASATLQVYTPSSATNATYGFDATAADSGAGGASSMAHGAVVIYSDATPPTLAITSPVNGANVGGRMVSISASASDASGIQAVEFYVDGVLLARDTSAPYSANWNLRKVAAGPHNIRVRAVDNAGNATESTVTITK